MTKRWQLNYKQLKQRTTGFVLYAVFTIKIRGKEMALIDDSGAEFHADYLRII